MADADVDYEAEFEQEIPTRADEGGQDEGDYAYSDDAADDYGEDDDFPAEGKAAAGAGGADAGEGYDDDGFDGAGERGGGGGYGDDGAEHGEGSGGAEDGGYGDDDGGYGEDDGYAGDDGYADEDTAGPPADDDRYDDEARSTRGGGGYGVDRSPRDHDGGRSVGRSAYSGEDGSARGGATSVEHSLGAGALTAESRRILARQSLRRDAIKQRMLRQRRVNEQRKQAGRVSQVDRWRRKLSKSPFAVDQLAEHERMDEEQRVRQEERARRERLLAKRREQVKAEIIVKALAEESDVDALRAEKRAILSEEQRIKALLELEKAKLHRKADMQAAIRAERQRMRAKREYRRDKFSTLQRKRQATVRQQKMLANGLVTDPKTGFAVPVETEEGWFALQELDKAGTLPPEYRPFLDGPGADEAAIEAEATVAGADASAAHLYGGRADAGPEYGASPDYSDYDAGASMAMGSLPPPGMTEASTLEPSVAAGGSVGVGASGEVRDAIDAMMSGSLGVGAGGASASTAAAAPYEGGFEGGGAEDFPEHDHDGEAGHEHDAEEEEEEEGYSDDYDSAGGT